MKKIAAMLVLASGFLLTAGPASAEDFLSLKLTGVNGTSTVAGHVNEIVILSFSLGVTSPSKQKNAPQTCSDLNVMKSVDQVSPILFQHTAFGIDSPQAVLTFSQGPSSAGPVTDVYKVTLNNVSINSVQHSGNSGGGLPTESVSLSATSWVISFQPAVGPAVTQTVNCVR